MTVKIRNLVLSLTGECNFSCRYCYAAYHNKAMMSEATAVAAVRLAASGKEKFILQFTGGEPLLNFRALQAAVDFVKKENLPALLKLQTNGSLLTEDVASYLYRNHVAIGISLDGRPAVNDRLRLTRAGAGATRAALRGLEVLSRNQIACGLTCVVTDENVQQLAGIVEFAYFLGNIRRIGFDILRRQGRGCGLNPPAPEAMKSSMERVYATRDRLKKLTGLSVAIAQEERVRTLRTSCNHCFGHCYAMNGEAAFVDAEGAIYACSSLVGERDFYLGDVEHGLDARLVAENKAKIATAMNFCRQCADFKLCGGGCFARWYGLKDKSLYAAECALQRVSIGYVARRCGKS